MMRVPPGCTLSAGTGNIAISADGTRIITLCQRGDSSELLSRALDSLSWTAIPKTKNAEGPQFEPTGHAFHYLQRDQVFRANDDGTAPAAVGMGSMEVPAVGPDGALYFAPTYNSGVAVIERPGSAPRMLTKPDLSHFELGHWSTRVLPGGRRLLINNFSMPLTRSRIEVRELSDPGKPIVLAEDFVNPRYVDGILLMARGDVLYAAPFDSRKNALERAPVAVMSGIANFMTNGVASYDVSVNGTLVYMPISAVEPTTGLVYVDRTGHESEGPRVNGVFATGLSIRFSPDEKRVALGMRESGNTNISVYDLERGVMTRITDRQASTDAVAWSPDGMALYYDTELPVFDLYRRASDAATEDSLVLSGPFDKTVGSVSPDGTQIFVAHTPKGIAEIATVNIVGPRKLTPLFRAGTDGLGPIISPDGRWLAYISNESGSRELYVRSYPDVNRVRQQVSTGGVSQGRWTKGGRELVYYDGQSMLAVPFDLTTGKSGRPATLFRRVALRTWDVTADGERFLMPAQPTDNTQQVIVVVNWLQSVKARLAAERR
jgi:eukaryotic-like serine/threonine-protein kinase